MKNLLDLRGKRTRRRKPNRTDRISVVGLALTSIAGALVAATSFLSAQGTRSSPARITQPSTQSASRASDDSSASLSPELQLLQLKLKEKELLEYLGRDHPDVRAVRSRIDVLNEFLAAQAQIRPAPAPTLVTPPEPAPVAFVVPSQPAPVESTSTLEQPSLLQTAYAQTLTGSTTNPTGDRTILSIARLHPVPESLGEIKFHEPPLVLSAELLVPKQPEEKLVPQAAPVVADSPSGGAPQAQSASLLTTATLQLLTTFPAMMLGLLVHVTALVFLFRRLGGQFAPLFKIELVQSGMGVPALAPIAPSTGPSQFAHMDGAATLGSPDARPVVFDVASSAQPFELGPTYEEEMALRAAEEQQREQGLLRRLFEQNLEMQEQLVSLQEPTA